jgi:hypothetical protein
MVSLESRSGPYWNSLYAQATSEPSKWACPNMACSVKSQCSKGTRL